MIGSVLTEKGEPMPRYIDADFCKMLGGTCIAIRLTSTGEVFPIVGLDEIPSADVVNRSQLIETIKHYTQYPDGIHKLLAVYAERRTDAEEIH